MKERYITEFWQSLKLLQAGLDRETADYVYQRSMEVSQPGGEDGAQHFEPVYTPRPRRDGDAFTTDVIPAWSLGRIWDLFTERGWHYDFSTATPAGEVINLLVDALIVKIRNQ